MELLNDMALFVEVVKARGFRRAAEAVGIPNSTVSRRISSLEKAIGLRLLHRTTRKIELTEAGQIYFQRCKRIVDEAKLAHEQLGELLAQPSGVLRASLPVDFANIYLAPLIAEFARRYPGISFDLDLTPRLVDLVSEPFDVAIRMGNPPNSNLIARQLSVVTRLDAALAMQGDGLRCTFWIQKRRLGGVTGGVCLLVVAGQNGGSSGFADRKRSGCTNSGCARFSRARAL